MSNINKKPNIDFDVRSDLYNLFIIDNSCWGIAQNLPAVIEIYLPGAKNPYKDYFGKTDTSYNSFSLGITCGDVCDITELNDGLYTIIIKASPDTFFKEYTYLKSDQLERDIDKSYIKYINESCGENCKSEVIHAKFLLNTAHAYNRLSDRRNANEYYQMSKRILDKLVNCKNCK